MTNERSFKVHTAEWVRSSSTVLFSAILAVSAKFFRPALYPTLLAHAQQLVTRGIADALSQIGLVQALCLLVYWKVSPFPPSFFLPALRAHLFPPSAFASTGTRRQLGVDEDRSRHPAGVPASPAHSAPNSPPRRRVGGSNRPRPRADMVLPDLFRLCLPVSCLLPASTEEPVDLPCFAVCTTTRPLNTHRP
jgi:hypothetical protein